VPWPHLNFFKEKIMALKEVESSHWYTPNGDPAHQWEGKPTTLRTAKKLQREKGLSLLPSVTNTLGILAKPALTRWFIEQGIISTLLQAGDLGMLNKKGKNLCHDIVEEGIEGKQFKQDAYERSRQRSGKATDFGTRWHAMAEAINLGEEPAEDLELEPYVPLYRAWKEQNLGKIHFAEMRVVNKEVGYAGCADLVCELHDHPGEIFVLDFKTSSKLPKQLKAWPDHCWQLASYAEAIKPHFNGQTIRTGNVMVSSLKPAEPKLHLWKLAEQGNGWQIFKCATEIWQRTKDYKP
jgi:hypothetical protein